MTVPIHIRNRRKRKKPTAVLTVPKDVKDWQVRGWISEWKKFLPKSTLILREGFKYADTCRHLDTKVTD